MFIDKKSLIEHLFQKHNTRVLESINWLIWLPTFFLFVKEPRLGTVIDLDITLSLTPFPSSVQWDKIRTHGFWSISAWLDFRPLRKKFLWIHFYVTWNWYSKFILKSPSCTSSRGMFTRAWCWVTSTVKCPRHFRSSIANGVPLHTFAKPSSKDARRPLHLHKRIR